MSEHPTPRTITRTVSRREALDAAARLKVGPDGQGYVLRFSPIQRVQHAILMVTFLVQAVSGLPQLFPATGIGRAVLRWFGGLDAASDVHRIASLAFAVLAVYHVATGLDLLFVRRQGRRMLPGLSDLAELQQIIRFNLSSTAARPQIDRFGVDEKFIYWLTLKTSLLLVATGAVLWFPFQAAEIFFTAAIIPLASLIHRWLGILLVVVFLVLHIYQAFIKRFNLSIFTGRMSLEAMAEDHPLELAYLEKAAALVNHTEWPATVELPLAETPAQSIPAKEGTE